MAEELFLRLLKNARYSCSHSGRALRLCRSWQLDFGPTPPILQSGPRRERVEIRLAKMPEPCPLLKPQNEVQFDVFVLT
jgi:hypothetical protein